MGDVLFHQSMITKYVDPQLILNHFLILLSCRSQNCRTWNCGTTRSRNALMLAVCHPPVADERSLHYDVRLRQLAHLKHLQINRITCKATRVKNMPDHDE